MTGFFDQLARMSAAGLADSLVLGFAVAAIVWAALALLRRHRAATRFAVLVSALVALSALPLVRALAHSHGGPATTPLLHLGETWAAWVAAIWAAGATIGVVRIVVGLATLHRMRRLARPLSLRPELLDIVREFCPSRRVDLLVSDSVAAPCAIGFFRPAVLLPSWIIDELSLSELRHILIHELSHLRRRDDWTNLFQRAVQAVFFFHPAVWWMESRLSLEREMACDDAVLSHSSSPRAYAECLARLAEKSLLRRGLALAQAAVSRMRQTSQRVARILCFDTAARGSKFAVSVATVFALSGFGVLLNAPTLISFSPSSPVTLASGRQETSPVAVAAATRQFRRHPVGSAIAFNTSWRNTPQPNSADAANTGIASAAPQNAADKRLAAPVHAVERSVAKRPQPAVRVVQATLDSHAPHAVTYVFVLRTHNSVTVWQISTWQFAPSQQVRADRKTT